MQGSRLEVEAHIVTGASTSVSNLVKCIRDAGVEVDDLILQPLASGEAVLTDEEREMGVVLADIGGGTTDIGIFMEGSIWHTVILGVGGEHFTRDIAVGLRTPSTRPKSSRSSTAMLCPTLWVPRRWSKLRHLATERGSRYQGHSW